MKTPRVVFDVTVLVDALLRPDQASAGLLRRLVTERDFELVVSPPILHALERALRAPSLEPFLAGSLDQLTRYVAALGVIGMTVAGDSEPNSTQESSSATRGDEIYRAAALEAGASLVVSLDLDQLGMGVGPGLPVVEPEVLLELLEARRLGAPG